MRHPGTPPRDRSSAPQQTQLLNSPEVADLRDRILTQQTLHILTLMPQQCYLRSRPRPLLPPRFPPALHRETVSFLCRLPSNQPKLWQGNQQKEQPKSYNSSAVAAELCSKCIYNFPPSLLESCMLAVRPRLSRAKLLGAARDICFRRTGYMRGRIPFLGRKADMSSSDISLSLFGCDQEVPATRKGLRETKSWRL